MLAVKKSIPFLLLAILCGATGAQSRPQAREIWINSNTYSDPFALLNDLDEALRDHPQARRFRLWWGTAFPHGGDGGALIYDKTRQILWVSQESNSLWPRDGDEEGEPSAIYNASYNSQQWLFSRVTPNRLRLGNTVSARKTNTSATRRMKSRFSRACRSSVVAAVW